MKIRLFGLFAAVAWLVAFGLTICIIATIAFHCKIHRDTFSLLGAIGLAFGLLSAGALMIEMFKER